MILYVFLFIAISAAGYAQDFEIIKDKSHINFISYTKMLGVNAEVNGSFTEFSIKAIKNPILTNSTVEVNIPSNSINTDNSVRDSHLKKEDFFDEKKFKNISFKSDSIKDLGNKTYNLSGTLKIKDKITQINIKLNAEEDKNNLWHIKGDTILSRSTLGINYKAPFFLPEVKDEVKIIIDIWLKAKIS